VKNIPSITDIENAAGSKYSAQASSGSSLVSGPSGALSPAQRWSQSRAVGFACDSPVEEAGFELLVPPATEATLETSA
jgi:hypothetical protein